MTSSAPWASSIQCVHPRRVGVALDQLARNRPQAHERVLGIKANAADASLAELEASSRVQADDPEAWASQLHGVQQDHGSVLVGGCCGTDERHLFSLALRLAAEADADERDR